MLWSLVIMLWYNVLLFPLSQLALGLELSHKLAADFVSFLKPEITARCRRTFSADSNEALLSIPCKLRIIRGLGNLSIHTEF